MLWKIGKILKTDLNFISDKLIFTKYSVILKKSGEINNYHFYSIFNLKDEYQFTVIITDVLDEKYKIIPKAILKINEIPHFNNVYIYCERINVNINEVESFFKMKGLNVIIRDKKYFDSMKYDFFISYDHRDKNIARLIAEKLQKHGYKVWYDEFSLKIGDSLSESIQRGIAESKYGIVIISNNLLSNERWAKNELQTIMTKQISNNKLMLLPVWHNVSEEDIKNRGYYWILDKVAANTKDGIETVVDKLIERI